MIILILVDIHKILKNHWNLKFKEIISFNQSNTKRQLNHMHKLLEDFEYNQTLYDLDSIYFSNRSVANKLLNRFQEAKQDSQQTLKIDSKNFIYGTIILIEVQMFPDITESLIKQAQLGIKELEFAQEQVKISKNQQKNKLRVLINQNLAKGKKDDIFNKIRN